MQMCHIPYLSTQLDLLLSLRELPVSISDLQPVSSLLHPKISCSKAPSLGGKARRWGQTDIKSWKLSESYILHVKWFLFSLVVKTLQLHFETPPLVVWQRRKDVSKSNQALSLWRRHKAYKVFHQKCNENAICCFHWGEHQKNWQINFKGKNTASESALLFAFLTPWGSSVSRLQVKKSDKRELLSIGSGGRQGVTLPQWDSVGVAACVLITCLLTVWGWGETAGKNAVAIVIRHSFTNMAVRAEERWAIS